MLRIRWLLACQGAWWCRCRGSSCSPACQQTWHGSYTPDCITFTPAILESCSLVLHLQWDMLDITRGLAGWRLVAASTPECPADGVSPTAAVLAFQLASGLARLTVTLRPADAGAGAAVAQAVLPVLT